MGVRVTETAVRVSGVFRFITLLWVCLVSGLAAWLVLGVWLKGSRPPLTAIAATALTFAVVLSCGRALRLGVRMDASGVTVRNFFATHKISCAEVSHLGDGSVHFAEGDMWALGVVLRDGRVISSSTIIGHDLTTAEADEIRQAAARYEVRVLLGGFGVDTRIPARPTSDELYEDPGGQAGLRYWDGSSWSPLLPKSAGEGRAVHKSISVWAALPVAPEPWAPRVQDTAAKAARAKVWVVLCAVLIVALPVAGLVIALVSGNWFWVPWVGVFALLPLKSLMGTWGYLRRLADLEKWQRALSPERAD